LDALITAKIIDVQSYKASYHINLYHSKRQEELRKFKKGQGSEEAAGWLVSV